MRMLCYGDSNTYGYDPRGFFGDRYPKESRWVDILAKNPNWEILNAGENGREVPVGLFQYQQVAALLEQSKPDLFAVMLGTNDLLQGSTAQEVCERMEAFLQFIQLRQLLLIAPPPMVRGRWVPEGRLIGESVKLAELYQALSRKLGIAFADAEKWNVAIAFDGVHFTEEGNRLFAQGLYGKLMEDLEG